MVPVSLSKDVLSHPEIILAMSQKSEVSHLLSTKRRLLYCQAMMK